MAIALRHEEELNKGEGMRLSPFGSRVLPQLRLLLAWSAATGGLLAVLGGLYLHGGGVMSGTVAETDTALAFVQNSQRCAQLLGGDDSGDTLPTEFSVELDAALNASRLPAAQTLAQLGSRCRQR